MSADWSPTLTPWEEVAEASRADFRALIDERITPMVASAEREQKFPVELFKELGKAGFLRIGAPVEQGGAGGGRTSEVMVVEELTRACAGVTMSVVPFFIVRIAIWEFGSAEAIKEVGQPMIQGERVVGICMSEPDAGSDVASIKTEAVRDGDGWRITGNKMFITNGTLADDLLVVARTRDAAESGIGLFLMSTDQEGYSAQKLDKYSSLASDTTEVRLDGCFVPSDRVVGSPTTGFRQAMRVLNGERILSAARAVALARQSWDSAEQILLRGTDIGPRLGDQAHQGPMAAAMGEIWMIELALREVCRLWDAGESAVAEISMLKTEATKRSVAITRALQQLVGPEASRLESSIGRNARDARLGTVAAGSEQMMHRILARQRGWPHATH